MSASDTSGPWTIKSEKANVVAGAPVEREVRAGYYTVTALSRWTKDEDARLIEADAQPLHCSDGQCFAPGRQHGQRAERPAGALAPVPLDPGGQGKDSGAARPGDLRLDVHVVERLHYAMLADPDDPRNDLWACILLRRLESRD